MSEEGRASTPDKQVSTPPGDGLAAVQALLRTRRVTCEAVVRTSLKHSDALATEPLALAASAIARMADVSGRSNAYHNPDHSRDVAVGWLWLAARCEPPLSAEERLLGLCAALGHDLDHDGRGNTVDGRYIPFRLEAIAADTTARILLTHQVTGDQAEQARCCILLTDPVAGYPVLEASLNDGSASQRPVHPCFAQLAHPAVRRMAAMLRDADLAPSAASRPQDHDARTCEMLQEQGGGDTPTTAYTEHFLCALVGGVFLSQPGQALTPSLERLIQLNRRRGDSAALADLTPAFPPLSPAEIGKIAASIGLADVLGVI